MSVHFSVPEIVAKYQPLVKYESLRAVYVFLGTPQQMKISSIRYFIPGPQKSQAPDRHIL